MFVPKKTKFRKAFKGRIKGNAKGGFSLAFGDYGLKALEPERITSKHIESVRRSITRSLKRTGKVWIRIFPHVPVSKKPADVRMGKGKGGVDCYVFKVKPGCILFEIGGVSMEMAKTALLKAMSKLPMSCKFVCNEN